MDKLLWNNEIEFYDLHSEDLFSKFPFYHTAMIGDNEEEFLNYIIKTSKIDSNSIVVDLGCGGGYVVNSLNKFCKSIGISTSKECIKQAKINYPDSKFEVANMETFSNKNSTHFLTLESMGYADVEKTFKNVYNNLQKNGILYTKEWYKKFKETKEQKDNREHFEHYFKYIPKNVTDVVRIAYESGFHLLSLNDLSDIFDASMYLECSKYHKVEYIPPHSEISFVNSMELLFIKK